MDPSNVTLTSADGKEEVQYVMSERKTVARSTAPIATQVGPVPQKKPIDMIAVHEQKTVSPILAPDTIVTQAVPVPQPKPMASIKTNGSALFFAGLGAQPVPLEESML